MLRWVMMMMMMIIIIIIIIITTIIIIIIIINRVKGKKAKCKAIDHGSTNVLRHSFGIINYNKEEIVKLDRKQQKCLLFMDSITRERILIAYIVACRPLARQRTQNK
jgi:hypothetical protein